MRRFTAVIVFLGAACSGRAPDAGPTSRGDHAGSARPRDPAVNGGRTPRPLDAALVGELAAVTVPDHVVTVVRRGDSELAAIVAAPGGARVTITASDCLGCTAMALPAGEARRAELAALWAPVEGAGDRLALSAPTLVGRTVIVIDATRTLDGELRRVYQLHWNDGVTQLAGVCEAAARLEVNEPGDAGLRVPAPACDAAAATAMSAFLAAM